MFLLSAFGLAGAGFAGQPPPQISLDPSIECWYHSEFPVLAALVTPPDDVVRSRLYFRCSLYPDYYFVDLKDESGAFRGVAPQAEENCPQVHYYVEALSRDFASTRTEERVAQVSSPDECRRRYPGAAWFPGDDPNILLGSLGTTGLAPGFKSVGIAGFISSTGGAVALGAVEGGISTGMVAGIAAGGAAAAGLGVLATGGGGATTTTASLTVPPPATTTGPPTTTSIGPAPSGLRACFTLDPADGNVEVNESLRVDGRCSEGGDGLSFHYDLGDGRVKEGQAFMTAVWPAPGSYTLTLTVSRESPSARAGRNLEEDSVSREIRVQEPPPPPQPPPPPPGPVVADFTARNVQPDLCVGEFDGSPSQGDIVRYLWALDLDNAFGQGVITKEGRVVVHDWKADCYRAQGNLRARLTVFGRGGNESTVEKQVNILSFTPALLPRDGIESSFASEMLESKDARGQIVIEGGPSFAVSGEAPTWVRYRGKRGLRALEAVATASGAAFLWRLDFTVARGFVPGSLRTVGGQEAARDAYSVTLRFSGAAMERVRIEYQLEP